MQPLSQCVPEDSLSYNHSLLQCSPSIKWSTVTAVVESSSGQYTRTHTSVVAYNDKRRFERMNVTPLTHTVFLRVLVDMFKVKILVYYCKWGPGLQKQMAVVSRLLVDSKKSIAYFAESVIYKTLVVSLWPLESWLVALAATFYCLHTYARMYSYCA